MIWLRQLVSDIDTKKAERRVSKMIKMPKVAVGSLRCDAAGCF